MSTTEALALLHSGQTVSEMAGMSDATVRHLEQLAEESLLVRTIIKANGVPFRAWRRATGAVL